MGFLSSRNPHFEILEYSHNKASAVGSIVIEFCLHCLLNLCRMYMTLLKYSIIHQEIFLCFKLSVVKLLMSCRCFHAQWLFRESSEHWSTSPLSWMNAKERNSTGKVFSRLFGSVFFLFCFGTHVIMLVIVFFLFCLVGCICVMANHHHHHFFSQWRYNKTSEDNSKTSRTTGHNNTHLQIP